ncbi:ribonuclease Z [Enterococcus saccharolyticus]|uniref:Ribonuclease Z n=1 Tax=Candidatus Enterococcus willemsii TaxID=1857215 RepID=A0ABQ6YZ27_9ENTE|nr:MULTISPECIES: ribonuclease Z [Enterococcus]KAF1302935.1 ribonuclease Z [Enterococcus sp. CU12B]MCD5000913.1 ribonuclease Z [Enterococcus saccharolyticus]
MELEFLGTGSGVPAKHRNVSSVALRLLDERNAVWLFDCGEGTQMQILNTTIRPRKIEKIFISHLHGDHIFGLPGLVSSRSFQGGEQPPGPLEIYGPTGVEEFVRMALRLSKTRLNYPIKFIEMKEGTIFKDAQFEVSCLKLAHGIDSYGFRIVETDYQGELQVEALKALGVPAGPIYGRLKRGETVTLADGRVINGADFVGQPKKGRIVTILGDTRYCEQSIELAKDADVLIHESTYQKSEVTMARKHFHSTTEQAATVAKKANVRQLILTHISARYLGKDVLMLKEEAEAIFPNVFIAKDFYVWPIPFKEQGEAK